MAGQSYRIKVITRAGVIVSEDLPHKAPTTYEVIGFQPGSSSPQGNLGRASISLLAPTDEGGIAASIYYSQLDYLQRVEIYLGGQNSTPVWTGIVERLPQDLNTYTLEAVDSLALMTLGLTQRQQIINDTADQIARYALKDWALQFGDDFTGTSPLNSYTQVGTGASWVTATNTGMSGVQISSMTAGVAYYLLASTSYATAIYQAGAMIDADFIATTAAADATNGPGLVIGYTDSNNWVVAQLVADTTPGAGNIANFNVKIATQVAGVGTTLINVPLPGGVIAGDGTLLSPMQLRLIVSYKSPNYTYQFLINGQDFGCIASTTAAPSGKVGILNWSGGTGNGTTFVSNLYFFNRQSIFQEQTSPAWPVGSGTLTQKFDQSTLFDVLTTGLQGGAWSFRKEPAAGWNNDIITVAPTPGTDTSVLFEEGKNLTTAKLEPNQSKPASALAVGGKANSATAVTNISRNLAAINKYGHVILQANRADVADYVALRRIAQLSVKLSSNPGQAKTVTVDDSLTDGAYRELDTALFTIPSLGINASRRQVMARTFTEGSPLVQLALDQYPITKTLNAFRDIQTNIDALASAANFNARTMSILASAGANLNGTAGTTVNGVTGPPFGAVNSAASGEVILQSVTVVVPVTTSVLIKGIVTGAQFTGIGGGSSNVGGPIYVRAGSLPNSPIGTVQGSGGDSTVPAPPGTSTTVLQQLSLAAGTYTVNLIWNSVLGTSDRLKYYTALLYVFQLGV